MDGPRLEPLIFPDIHKNLVFFVDCWFYFVANHLPMILSIVLGAAAVVFFIMWFRLSRKMKQYHELPPFILKQHATSSAGFVFPQTSDQETTFACYPKIVIRTALPETEKEEVYMVSARS